MTFLPPSPLGVAAASENKHAGETDAGDGAGGSPVPLRSHSPCRQARGGGSQHVWRVTVRERGREKQQTHTSEGPCTGITPRSSLGGCPSSTAKHGNGHSRGFVFNLGPEAPSALTPAHSWDTFQIRPEQEKEPSLPTSPPSFHTRAREPPTLSSALFSVKTHQRHILKLEIFLNLKTTGSRDPP